MQRIKQFLFILVLALACGTYSTNTYAQEVVVGVRPHMPHFDRGPAPSPRHVWIGEEWEPRGGAYVFVGGHWAEPPHPGWMWIPGHWKDTPRGSIWVAGHCRHR